MALLPPIKSNELSGDVAGSRVRAVDRSNTSMSTLGHSPKRGGATPAPGAVLRAAVDLVSTKHFTTSDERRRLCLDRRYRTGRTIGDASEPFATGLHGVPSPLPATYKSKTPQPPEPVGAMERLGTADDTVARRGVPTGNPFAVVDTGGARSGPSEIDFSSDRSYRFYRLECADPLRILAAYSKRQEHVQRQRDDAANAERKRARQMMRSAAKLEQDALRNRELAGQLDAMLTEAVRDKDTVSSRESSRGPPSRQRQRGRSIAAVSTTGQRRQSVAPPKAAVGTPASKSLTVVVPPSRENMGTRGSSSCGSTRMAASTSTAHAAGGAVPGSRSILRDSRRRRSGSVASAITVADTKPKPKVRPAPRPISPSNFMPDWRERLHRKLNPHRLPTPEPQEARAKRTVPVFVPDETIIAVIRRFAIIDEMAGGSLHGRDIAAFHAFHGWPLPPSAHAALKQGHTEAFNVSAYLQLALPQLGRKWQVARACTELKRLIAEYVDVLNAGVLERQASAASRMTSSEDPPAGGANAEGEAANTLPAPGRRKSAAPGSSGAGSRRGTVVGKAAKTPKRVPAASSSGGVDPSPRGPEYPPLAVGSVLLLSMVPLDSAIDAMLAPGESASAPDGAAVAATPGSLGGTIGRTTRFALDTSQPVALAPAEMAAIAHIREGLSTGRWVQRCAKLLPDGRDTLRRMHLEYQRLRGSKNIGGIPWKPFRRAFQRLMGEDDLQAYFRRADRDGDGCLNFHEFVEAIWSGYADGAAVPHRDIGDL